MFASPTATRACPWTPAHERFTMDHNRCILCTRCVRVCMEIEGAHTWGVFGRGVDAHLITDLDIALGHVGYLHELRQVRSGLPHRRSL